MRILTWNVNFHDAYKRGLPWNNSAPQSRTEGIVAAISKTSPDILVLTEFGLESKSKNASGKTIIRNLDDSYKWFFYIDSRKYDTGEDTCAVYRGNSKYSANKVCYGNPCHTTDVYIFVKKESILYIEHLPNNKLETHNNRWVEVVLSAKAGRYNEERLRVLGVHIPLADDNDQKGRIGSKSLFWSEVLDYSNANAGKNTVIIGDFNTYLPRDSGNGAGSLLSENITKLKEQGYVDAWRESNPKKSERTWTSERGNNVRLDYAFVSPKLKGRLMSANHIHEVRENNLSDHSALMIEIDD